MLILKGPSDVFVLKYPDRYLKHRKHTYLLRASRHTTQGWPTKSQIMNQSNRLQEILKLLDANASCSIAELAVRFNVSEETVRRDVRQLESTGRVCKVHGGVRLPDNVFEAAYHQRINENASEKRLIAARAAEMVEDGMTLLMDSGTTTCWLARALNKVRDLTIITNSFEVVREMSGRNNTRIFFAGGEANADYCGTFGQEAQAFLQRFTPEITFFSIGAIEASRGLLDFLLEEAEMKRAIAPLSRRVVVMADSTKFERHGLIRALDFKDIHVLISNQEPPPALRTALGDIDVHIAKA